MTRYFEEAPAGDPVALMDQILATAAGASDALISEFGHTVLGLDPDCSPDEVLRELCHRESGAINRFFEDVDG